MTPTLPIFQSPAFVELHPRLTYWNGISGKFEHNIFSVPGLGSFAGWLPTLTFTELQYPPFPDFVHWTLPPVFYNPNAFLKTIQSLPTSLWKWEKIESTWYFDLTQKTFEVSHGNRKKIQQCLSSGATIQRVPLSNWLSVYELISLNRKDKGYTLSMSPKQVEEMIFTFPNQTRMFEVVNPQNQRLAAAWVLIPLPDYAQVVYWAHHPSAEALSPVALLCEGIQNYCRAEGITYLDLGTATTSDGIPNAGLTRFKQNLGALPSLKCTLSLDIKKAAYGS